MKKQKRTFKKDQVVYDRWWPYRRGVVIKALKTRVHVEWSDGQVWNYDQAHQQFLEVSP